MKNFRFTPSAAILRSKSDLMPASLLSAFLLFWSAAAICAQPAQVPASRLLPPSALRCAGQTAPLSVADAQPAFSWHVAAASASLRGVSQSAYEIRIGALDAGAVAGAAVDPILWSSGVVHSGATSGVLYAGPALQPHQFYAWQVRVWDEAGHATAWSRTARWAQAPIWWRVRWIAAPTAGISESMPLFRKAFTLDAQVVRAVLYASGMGQDELRINGRKVGNDELTPGWSEYRKTVYYDSYDVTALVHAGENALGVLLGNGMYRVIKTPGRYTKFEGSYGLPKCIVQLHVELAGGKTVELVSDSSWKTAPGPVTFSSTYGGEDFDARREPQGWDRPGFDDGQWRAALEIEGPGGELQPEVAPPLRVMHTYTPHAPSQPRPGVLVYDLGQNFAGWPSITVAGPAGATVKLIPGELLNKDGTVSQRSSGEPQWFAYTLRGAGQEHWHPRFSYYGFRYVQVEGAGLTRSPERAQILSLRGEAVHSSSAATGTFTSSDQLLNRIHTLILRAIENNSVSLFTDCPHREKLGWLEETHLLASAMLYDFDFAGLYAATARNIADSQQVQGPETGNVPTSAPPYKVGRVAEIAPQYVLFEPQWGIFDDSPEWGSAAVLAPWYVYQRDGDLGFLAAQYDVMRLYTAYLGTRANQGIIAYGLGDWYDIGPDEPGVSKLTTPGVTATAIYYQDLRVLERSAALLGKTDDAAMFRRQADEERAAFNARFLDTARHRYDTAARPRRPCRWWWASRRTANEPPCSMRSSATFALMAITSPRATSASTMSWMRCWTAAAPMCCWTCWNEPTHRATDTSLPRAPPRLLKHGMPIQTARRITSCWVTRRSGSIADWAASTSINPRPRCGDWCFVPWLRARSHGCAAATSQRWATSRATGSVVPLKPCMTSRFRRIRQPLLSSIQQSRMK